MKTAKIAILSLVVLSLALSLPATVRADWNESDPAKWVQLPDLTTDGMDVLVTVRDGVDSAAPDVIKVLADDFKCTKTGPVTDIHIWGSWKDDLLPPPRDVTIGNPTTGAGNVMFFLGILADIPADHPRNNYGYSMPGQLLWGEFFFPGQFTSREYYNFPADSAGEGWYDPNEDLYTPNADKTIWQYNFLIPEANAFQQLGTTDEPIIYWLALVAAVDPELLNNHVTTTGDLIDEPLFGWKTSPEHWNDDAVWTDLVEDPNGPITGPDGVKWGFSPWSELRYPNAHPNETLRNQSIDLAFVITPEPATLLVLALGLIPALLKRRRKA